MGDAYQRYELGGSIASGGMGEILLARDIELNRDVALKRMLFVPDESDGPEAAKYFERFLEEAQITAQLDHPSIVPIHSIGFDNEGRAFYTMRMVKGRELGDIYRLVREAKEGWNQARVIGVLIKVCQAVAFAHSKGIAHRDLKPSNIMVGELGEVYVMDWGLAKAFECLRREGIRSHDVSEFSSSPGREGVVATDLGREETLMGCVIGTPAYLAPEMASGAQRNADPQGDVYALGAVLYHLLAGHAPYMADGESTTAEAIIQLVQGRAPLPIPQMEGGMSELVAICDRAMARERSTRYGTCLDLAEELQAYLDGRVVRAYESGNVARFRKWVMRNRVLSAAFAMVLLALIAIAWISTWSNLELGRALEQTELERERTVGVLAESFFLQGLQYAKQHDFRLALANWAQALLHDPEHHSAAARIASSCMQYLIPVPSSLPLRFDSEILGLGIDPAGRFLAVNDNGESVRLWDRVAKQWTHRWDFEESPRRLAFQPQGTLIVAFVIHQGWQYGEIHWLDTATGKRRWPSVILNESVTGIEASFSKDGKFMAALGRVWSMDDGRQIMAPETPTGSAIEVLYGVRTDLSGDGRWLLLGAESGVVTVHDVQRQVEVGHVKVGRVGRLIANVVWSREATRFACSLNDGSVYVFDRRSLQPIGGQLSHLDAVEPIFGLDENTLITAGGESSIRVWDLSTKELLMAPIDIGAAVRQVKLSADGSKIVSVGTNDRVRLWDAKTGEALCESIPFCRYGDISGDRLLTLNTDGFVEEWNIPNSTAQAFTLRYVPQTNHECASLSPNGQFIIGPGVQAYRVDTGAAEYLDPRRNSYEDSVIAVAPDSTRFAIATGAGGLSLRSSSNGELIREFSDAPPQIEAVSFSPSGQRLAAIGKSGLLCVWVCDEYERAPIRIHRPGRLGNPLSIRFSRAETALCLSTWGGGEFAWDLTSGRTIASRDPGQYALYPNFLRGDRLVVAFGSHQFELWDSRIGGLRESFLLSHNFTIVSLDYSPNERFVATASHDTTVQVWDLDSGQAVGARLKHLGPVYNVAFSPDETRLASLSAGGLFDLWDRASGVPLVDSFSLPETGVRKVEVAADGLRALVVGASSYSLWDLPPPESVTLPSWWASFAESVAGIRIRRVATVDGPERIVTEQTPISDRFELWNELRDSSENGPYTQIAQWFLSAGQDRAESPYRIRSRRHLDADR